MKFEIGKTYQHNTGKRMTIIGRLNTHTYGECLIGECDTGELVPVGESEENAVNWHEQKCPYSEQEPCEDAISKADAMRLVSKVDLKGLLSQDDACLVSVASVKRALEQEPRKITLEDVKGYCKPRCLTIITNDLLYELTHPKIKALEQEPCEDCISRKAVLDIVDSYSGSRSNVEDVTQDIISDIMALPTVTQKQKMGYWTERKIHEPTGFFLPTCSECGGIMPYTHHTFRWNYCPSCGAKMERK